MARIFISYARDDLRAAKKVYEDLRASQHDPWLDTENLLPGQPWKAAIKKAISESDFFVALMSKHSVNKRGYVQKELRHAIDILEESPEENIFVIPARLDDCHPSHSKITGLHRVDLWPNYEEGFQKVLAALKRQHASDPKRDISPGPIMSAELEDAIKHARAATRRRDTTSACCLWKDVRNQAESEGNTVEEMRARLEIAHILIQDESTLDEALNIADTCLQETNTVDRGSFRCRILQLISEIHLNKGDTELARGFLTNALEHAKNTDSTIGEGFALLAFAAIETSKRRHGDKSKAFESVELAHRAFLRAYAEGNDKEKERANDGFAQCHYWKAKALCNSQPDDALAEWSRALKLFQELGNNWEWNVADTLTCRAHLHAGLGETHLALIDLSEAAKIFQELRDTVGEAECYLEAATILDKIGRRTEAADVYRIACSIAATWNNERKASYYYLRYACKLIELRDYEKGEEILLSLVDADWLGRERRLTVISQLCLVAEVMKDERKIHELSTLALEVIDEAIREAESTEDRLSLLIQKGHHLCHCNQLKESVECFEKVIKSLETIGDKTRIIECLFHIRGVKQKLGDRIGERETAERLLSLDAERLSPMFAALSLVFLAQLNIGDHRYLEASSQLERAKELDPDNPVVCMISADLRGRLPKFAPKNVQESENVNLPPRRDLSGLLRELHEWCAAYPKNVKSILAAWYYIHKIELWGVIRSMLGIKFLICSEDAVKFQAVRSKLRLHGNLFLWGTNFSLRTSVQEKSIKGYDMIPIPKGFVYPAGIHVIPNNGKLFQGFFVEPYCLAYFADDDWHSGARPFFVGRKQIWRDLRVVKFMLRKIDSDQEDVDVICVPLCEGQALPGLRRIMQLATENGAIPVFSDTLPINDGTKAVCDCTVELPTAAGDPLEIAKEHWERLLSPCLDEPKTSLVNFRKSMARLPAVSPDERLPVRVYLLQFKADARQIIEGQRRRG